MVTSKNAIFALLVTLIPSLSPGLTRGETRLFAPDQPVPRSQPFTITVESYGNASGLPDLSMLERDFQIVNRRVSQQSSTVNGFRSQRTMLSITLLPKRSGSLEIPAIAFGTESTAPKRIEVMDGESGEAGLAAPPSVPATASPWTPPSPGMQPWLSQPLPESFQTLPPNQRWIFGGGQEPTAQHTTPQEPPEEPVPGLMPSPRMDQVPASPASPRVESSPPPTTDILEPREPSGNRRGGGGYPGWLVAVLLAGWIATLVFCWLSRRGSKPDRRVKTESPIPSGSPETPTSAPETDKSKVLSRIRKAFEQNDADSARDALLAWGELAWPGNAPANLTQLAARASGDLRAAILKLDSALYSPSPVPWNDLSILECLDQSGLGAPG